MNERVKEKQKKKTCSISYFVASISWWVLLWTQDSLLQLRLLVLLMLVTMVMLGGEQLGGIGGHHFQVKVWHSVAKV